MTTNLKIGDKVLITNEAVKDSEMKSNYGTIKHIESEVIYNNELNYYVKVFTNDNVLNTANLHELIKLY